MLPDPGRPTVVVVTWQGAHLLRPCLGSLAAQTLPHDVVVVDNASTDGTLELLRREFPAVRVLVNPVNTGFAGGVQTALDACEAGLVALLNNDAVAEPDWLAALVEAARRHPGAAAVTSRMLLTDRQPETLNNTGVVLLPDAYGADRGLGAPAGHHLDADEVFGFSGGAALLRADAVRRVGGFPVPFFLYYEDTDTSWRLRRAGWTVRYEPRAVVHHQHSASSDQRSAAFAFYNERNRLLTVLRNAPAGVVVTVWWRYLLTTGSLAVRHLTRQRVPAAHVFSVGLRLRAFRSAARLLPWALRGRRAAGPPWAPAGVTGRPVR